MNKASLNFRLKAERQLLPHTLKSFFAIRECDILHGSVLVCVSYYHIYYGKLFFPWSCSQLLQYSPLYLFDWKILRSKKFEKFVKFESFANRFWMMISIEFIKVFIFLLSAWLHYRNCFLFILYVILESLLFTLIFSCILTLQSCKLLC